MLRPANKESNQEQSHDFSSQRVSWHSHMMWRYYEERTRTFLTFRYVDGASDNINLSILGSTFCLYTFAVTEQYLGAATCKPCIPKT